MAKNISKELYEIIQNENCTEYIGRRGYVDFSNTHKTGNVMFYPIEGHHPYCVCLYKECVQKVEELE